MCRHQRQRRRLRLRLRPSVPPARAIGLRARWRQRWATCWCFAVTTPWWRPRCWLCVMSAAWSGIRRWCTRHGRCASCRQRAIWWLAVLLRVVRVSGSATALRQPLGGSPGPCRPKLGTLQPGAGEELNVNSNLARTAGHEQIHRCGPRRTQGFESAPSINLFVVSRRGVCGAGGLHPGRRARRQVSGTECRQSRDQAHCDIGARHARVSVWPGSLAIASCAAW